MYKKGDCFQIEAGVHPEDGRPKRRPIVVITDFDKYGRAILVSFSRTGDKDYEFDETCVVPAGIHPLIINESYAAYYLADIMTQEELQLRIANGEASLSVPFPVSYLEKIRDGLLKSDDTPDFIKDIFRDDLFNAL